MDSFFILELIILPLIIIALGSFMFNIYEYINRVKTRIFPRFLMQIYKQWAEMISRPSTPSNKIKGLVSYLYPFVFLACGILISWLIPLGLVSPFANHPLSLILILFFFIIIPIIRAYMVISSDNEQNITVAKKDIKKTAEYFLPILISVISLLYLLSHFYNDNDRIFNITDFIAFQTSASIEILGITHPALFIFLNPFAFLAFISAIIGYMRDTNLDIDPDEEQVRYWNPEKEFTGRRYLMILIGKCIELVFLISFPITLFLASGQFSTNILINAAYYFALLFILLLIIAIIGHGKPRTFVDRRILYFVRTPFFLALLSIAFTFFVINFDIPFVSLAFN